MMPVPSYISRSRLLIMGGVMTVMTFVLLGRLGYLQIYQVHFLSQKVSEQSIRKIRVPAPRGRIFDTEGRELVGNRPAYNVRLNLSAMRQPGARDNTIDHVLDVAGRIADATGRKLPISRTRIERRLKVYPALSWEIFTDLNEKELARAAELVPRLGGVDIGVDYARQNNYPGIASHVLGFTGRRRPPESLRERDYSYVMPELRGRAGLEKTFDERLTGQAGMDVVRVDSLGYLRETLSNPFKPEAGADLNLTLDIEAQSIAEDLLADEIGAFVVMDVDTGAVKALASSPGYDAASLTAERYTELMGKEKRRPLTNRAVGAAYLPGSIVKPLVGLAALEKGDVEADHQVYCDGRYEVGNVGISCASRYGHGDVEIVEAIKQSCNSYFVDIGMKSGLKPMRTIFRRAGLGEKPGIELDGVRAGRVPSEEWMRQRFDRGWLPIDSAYLSIGQFALNITPLQAAVFAGAIANGGTVYQPYIVDSIKAPEGALLESSSPLPVDSLRVKQENLQLIQRGMYLVVNSSSGTGRRAANETVSMAGKTGSAQVLTPDDRHTNAWFIGYAPADEPRYAFAVLVEYGDSGGREAAPLAGEFFERWLGGKSSD